MQTASVCGVHLFALLLVAAPFADAALGHSLPSRFPRCSKADLHSGSCGDEIIDKSLELLKDGIPELGVPSIDPLSVTAIDIGQGSGPVSLGIKFTNVNVRGLSKALIHNIKVNFHDKSNMSLLFSGQVEKSTFESDYEMSGRMLLVPIKGNGRCKLTYSNFAATVGPTGHMITVKGEEYFNVTAFPITVHKVDSIDFQFDNLFDGDKGLGGATQKLINENWDLMNKELLPVFKDVFSSLYIEYCKRIFGRVPFHEIFID